MQTETTTRPAELKRLLAFILHLVKWEGHDSGIVRKRDIPAQLQGPFLRDAQRHGAWIQYAVGHGLVEADRRPSPNLFGGRMDTLSLTPAGRAVVGGEAPKQATTSRAKRRPRADQKLTVKQTEALREMAECHGNVTKAAQRLGRDPATVRQHQAVAFKKLGQKHSTNPKTQALPTGNRGQETTLVKGKGKRRGLLTG